MFRKFMVSTFSLAVLAVPTFAQSPAPLRSAPIANNQPGIQIPGSALQGGMCGPRSVVVGLLKQQFGEEQEDVALHSEQSAVELFASEKGTWSIVLSSPYGTSCVVAAGKGLVSQAKS